jgi:zinc protease
MQRHLEPYPSDHVYCTLTPEESIPLIEETSLGAVRDFHKSFYGATAGEVAFVGDFDPEEIRGLMTELLDGWGSPTAYERIVVKYEERPPIFESIETPDKESAVFSAGLRLELSEEDPDYPALVLANFMTGGGFLNSRLATRIRQNEGLSYGVRSMFWTSRWDRSGRFGAFAIYAPQNDERLLAAFREEIQKIIDDGFSAEEVAEAQSGWLQQRTVSRSQGRELSRTLASRAHEQRTMQWDADLEKRIGELTPEEIHSAFRNHIHLDQISIVCAGDFANAPDEADARPSKQSRGEKPEGMAP